MLSDRFGVFILFCDKTLCAFFPENLRKKKKKELIFHKSTLQIYWPFCSAANDSMKCLGKKPSSQHVNSLRLVKADRKQKASITANPGFWESKSAFKWSRSGKSMAFSFLCMPSFSLGVFSLPNYLCLVSKLIVDNRQLHELAVKIAHRLLCC